MIQQPMQGADLLLTVIRRELEPQRLALIIGIDGRVGAGKSALAGWLAWHLGGPCIGLNSYIIAGQSPLDWHYAQLAALIDAQRETRKSIVVEGICLCRVLQDLNMDPDFLVWVENEGDREHGPEEPTDDYIREF